MTGPALWKMTNAAAAVASAPEASLTSTVAQHAANIIKNRAHIPCARGGQGRKVKRLHERKNG